MTGTPKGDGDQEAEGAGRWLDATHNDTQPYRLRHYYDTSSYQAFPHFAYRFTFRITAASHVHSNGVSACTTAKALTFTASSLSRSVTRHLS